jgi:S1-C subfamily serine protease
MKYFIGCLCSAILGSFLTVWLVHGQPGTPAIAKDDEKTASPARVAASNVDRFFNQDGLTSEEMINVSVYERLHKSVVNITTKSSRVDALFLIEHQSEGMGSGSVIDKTGHILTNHHVIAKAQNVSVTLFNGDVFEARVVGIDPQNDIAIIKIDAPEADLHPLTMGDSSKLKVGMRVLAIGNPFELERTLTTGIVSSLNRSLQVQDDWTIKSIIQIDAAINPGNSGGPLLDLHGRLIGMNTAIASVSGQSSGVGFAIPVNLVSRVVPDLIAHGKVYRPEVGIQRVFETEDGLIVERLTPGGPAEAAGVRGPTLVKKRRGPFVVERMDRSTADIIIAVDSKDVKTVSDFREAIEAKKPGELVTLTLKRGDRKIEVKMRLGGGPPEQGATGTRL